MKDTLQTVFAGFGGQGVLFAGKVMANSGLASDRELSWLPSYGPEMRGGTANCSVVLSDEPIGSPLVTRPDALVAMNQPSFDKFASCVPDDGIIVVDSSLVPSTEGATAKVHSISATKMAQDAGLEGLANIVLLGKLWKEAGFCTEEELDQAIEMSVPKSKSHLVEKNKEAIRLGADS